MDVLNSPDRVCIRATVSDEEVLIAAGGRVAASHALTVRCHAYYLLAHVHATADGERSSVASPAGPRSSSNTPYRPACPTI
jgi:hypothetical protein